MPVPSITARPIADSFGLVTSGIATSSVEAIKYSIGTANGNYEKPNVEFYVLGQLVSK